MRLPRWMPLLTLGLAAALPLQSLAAVEITNAIAMRSTPKYPANFQAFDYVNPNAPKGGDIRLAGFGTFDSLNPFINKGVAADDVNRIYDTLTMSSLDEPFTVYGLLAEKMERDPADNSWIIYDLNPKARFSDGVPVTAQDVVFTFSTIRKDGDPFYKAYYADIQSVQALDPHRVKFTFRTRNNPELPLIVGQLQILPKHYWEKRNFNTGNLEIPVGSGPYTITKIDPGRSITFTRNPNYWGQDLPVNRGINNFNSITYIYYRDTTVEMEGFKAGQYDFRLENKAKTWATEYNFPAVRAGYVKRLEPRHENPVGMQAFVYNLRRPLFQDIRVREALGYAFDFEWSNKALFNGAYKRTESFFANSELAATGLPSKEEEEILAPYRAQLPAGVFGPAYQAPKTDGSGNDRQNLLKAQELLTQAGWTMKGGKLTDSSGHPFSFEILLNQPELERIVQPFVQNLARLGVDAHIREIDVPQYVRRIRTFDFDMVVSGFGESLSPGNEQRDFWGSKAADQQGSRNIAGIKNPVVDALVDQIVAAPSREQLVAHVHALDRVLLSEYYMIPQYHINTYREAFWNIFDQPKVTPKYGMGFETWWVDPQRLASVRAAQNSGR